MAKIDFDELFSKDFLNMPLAKVEKMIKELEKLKSSVVNLSKATAKDVRGADPRTPSGVKKLSQAEKEANATKKLLNQTINQETKLRARLNVLKTEEAARAAKLKVQISQESDALKKRVKFQEENLRARLKNQKAEKEALRRMRALITLEDKEAGTIDKLAAKNELLRIRRSKLNLETRKGSRELIKINSQIDKNNKLIRKTSDAVKAQKENVGNYPRILNGVVVGWRKIAVAGTAAMAVFRGFSEVISVSREFEAAQTQLAAILGTTREETEALTEEALEYGATTKFTATQVSNLQTELAKFGFTAKEISDATPAILNLSAAFGDDLAETATVAAATVRGLGLTTSETARVTDVMAKAFSSSALDLEKWRESMKLVAPIARAANIPIETTGALLGKLADSGLSGTIAATGLKNLMSKLSDDSSKLSKELGFTVRNSQDLFLAFKELQKGNIDLSKATELTDERSKAAFLTLVNGIQDVEDLKTALDGAGGTAEKIAEQQLQTLDGRIKLLGSAWEGWILNIENGNSAISKAAKFVVDLGADLLSLATGTEKAKDELSETEQTVRKVAETLVKVGKVLVAVTGGFVAYRIAMAAANVLSKAYTATTTALRIAKVALSGGIKGATRAMKLFNITTKANPVGLLIGLLAAAVTAWYAFRDGANAAAEAQKAFNDQLKKSNDLRSKEAVKVQSEINKKLEAIDAEFALKKAQAGSNEEALEVERLEKRKALIEEERKFRIKSLEDQRNEASRIAEATENDLIALRDRLAEEEKKVGLREGTADPALKQRLRDEIKELEIRYEKESAIAKSFRDQAVKDAELFSKILVDEERNKQIAITNEQKDGIEDRLKREKELLILRRRLEDINASNIKINEAREIQQAKLKFDREIESIKGNSAIEIELRKTLEETKGLEIEKIKKKYRDKERDEERKAIEKQKELDNDITQNLERLAADEIKLEVEKQLELERIRYNAAVRAAQQRFRELEDKKKLKKLEEELEKEHERNKAKIKEDAKTKEEEAAKKLAEEQAQQRANEIEAAISAITELANTIGDYYTEESKQLEENYDRQIEASKRKEDQLLANVQARGVAETESIAFEKGKQDELEAKRIAEQKKQQKIKAILTALDIAAALARAGTQDAEGGAVSQIGGIVQGAGDAVAQLYDGTEYLPLGGNPKGKDTIPAMLHEGERVVPSYINSEMAGIKNSELPEAVALYKNFNGLNDPTVNYIQNDFAILERNVAAVESLKGEVKTVADLLRNRPVIATKASDIVKGLMDVVWENGNITKTHSDLGNKIF